MVTNNLKGWNSKREMEVTKLGTESTTGEPMSLHLLCDVGKLLQSVLDSTKNCNLHQGETAVKGMALL